MFSYLALISLHQNGTSICRQSTLLIRRRVSLSLVTRLLIPVMYATMWEEASSPVCIIGRTGVCPEAAGCGPARTAASSGPRGLMRVIYIYIYVYTHEIECEVCGDLVIIYPKPYSTYLTGDYTPHEYCFSKDYCSVGFKIGIQGIIIRGLRSAFLRAWHVHRRILDPMSERMFMVCKLSPVAGPKAAGAASDATSVGSWFVSYSSNSCLLVLDFLFHSPSTSSSTQ